MTNKFETEVDCHFQKANANKKVSFVIGVHGEGLCCILYNKADKECVYAREFDPEQFFETMDLKNQPKTNDSVLAFFNEHFPKKHLLFSQFNGMGPNKFAGIKFTLDGKDDKSAYRSFQMVVPGMHYVC